MAYIVQDGSTLLRSKVDQTRLLVTPGESDVVLTMLPPKSRQVSVRVDLATLLAALQPRAREVHAQDGE